MSRALPTRGEHLAHWDDEYRVHREATNKGRMVPDRWWETDGHIPRDVPAGPPAPDAPLPGLPRSR